MLSSQVLTLATRTEFLQPPEKPVKAQMISLLIGCSAGALYAYGKVIGNDIFL